MQTLVMAHRGASQVAPENTLAAFERAYALGAGGIELDVTLTRDGVPIVIHDDNVDRTTNGHGPVSQMTLEQVQRLDAGSWFGAEFCGERVPTLTQVFSGVGQRGVVNIELKGFTLEDNGLEVAVIHDIQAAGMESHVILSAFNPVRLWRARRLAPRIARGLLYMENLPIFLRRAWLRPLAGPTALHPKFTMVTPGLVQWARHKGYAINTWTVDEPADMKRLVGLGVDAIITNRPDVLAALVKNN